ncbi:MAG: hypothetical protein SFZ24_09615 [Planctomycetota bacterium]|nr:hypothetical protein [Planctomycetota bacterium]
MRRRNRRQGERRGSAAGAILILLAITQMVIAGMVLGGGREQDLSLQRVQTTRAFYAAEAGAALAYRELALNTDVDADGGIGSISADMNEASDPALGVARLVATRTEADGVVRITVTGRADRTERRVLIEVE